MAPASAGLMQVLSSVSTFPVPLSQLAVQAANARMRGQSFMFSFYDEEMPGPAGQEGWDMVLDGGSRLPFPLPALADQDQAAPAVVRLVLAHSRPAPPPGPAVSRSGYTSGGRPGPAASSQPWNPPWQNPLTPASAGPGKCGTCRCSPCRCASSRSPDRPRFSNKGMPGFDGEALPAPDPEMPDVMGDVQGYRWWTLTAPDLSGDPSRAGRDWAPGKLAGMRDRWDAGENIARCLTGSQRYHEDAEIPHPSCSCGFWAYWTLQVHDLSGTALPVCGVVKGYGAVMIGERGFRAARARIVALHLPFTIQPADGPDDDPLGLGLPQRLASRPASPHSPGGMAYGRSNPWWNHPKFTGKVYDYRGAPEVPEPPPPVPELDRASAAGRRAGQDRAEAWMAVIGDRLAVTYPDATVYQTRAAMEADYPPDLSYVPDSSQEDCPHCYGRYQRKLNHPATCANRRM
jgi:hypothetical protein